MPSNISDCRLQVISFFDLENQSFVLSRSLFEGQLFAMSFSKRNITMIATKETMTSDRGTKTKLIMWEMQKRCNLIRKISLIKMQVAC